MNDDKKQIADLAKQLEECGQAHKDLLADYAALSERRRELVELLSDANARADSAEQSLDVYRNCDPWVVAVADCVEVIEAFLANLSGSYADIPRDFEVPQIGSVLHAIAARFGIAL